MKYHFDNEEWRYKRIAKAVRLVCAILGISKLQLEKLIVEISDSKGILNVLWKSEHTINQENAFKTAWEECGENIVIHGDQDEIF